MRFFSPIKFSKVRRNITDRPDYVHVGGHVGKWHSCKMWVGVEIYLEGNLSVITKILSTHILCIFSADFREVRMLRAVL